MNHSFEIFLTLIMVMVMVMAGFCTGRINGLGLVHGQKLLREPSVVKFKSSVDFLLTDQGSYERLGQ